MAINVLKRLESSVNSFRLTLQGVKAAVDDRLRAIEQYEQHRSESTITLTTLEGMFDSEDAENDFLVGGRKTSVSLADMDCISWKRDLLSDQQLFADILDMIADITPEHDTKLQLLTDNIRHKVSNPINPGNRKVLIFTAFSDTAEYLYQNLAPTMQQLGLHTGLVTGDKVASTVNKVRTDFNNILTLFIFFNIIRMLC